MKLKYKITKSNFYRTGTIAVVALVAVSSAALLLSKRTNATPAVTSAVSTPASSQFSFSGAENWWQGATNKTSMALFHKPQDGCFVSIEHKTGKIAEQQAKTQKTNAYNIGNGYSIIPGTSQALTLQTNSGVKSYLLQQSTVVTPAGASKIKGGQEFGYIQLSNGYLYVQGYCDTSEALPATIPALSAIKFN